MNTNLLITFIVLNIANVIIQTVKSIATIKCGKTMAALVNAIAYGLYTVVVVYTVCDLPLWLKVIVVGIANLIGVFFVKWGEEKARKDKLWKIEATFDKEHLEEIHNSTGISHSYIDIGNHVIFNFYAENQRQSLIVKDIIQKYNGKYFVSESKTL
jgi:uncharacterized protein YebE (UPF0316 family)